MLNSSTMFFGGGLPISRVDFGFGGPSFTVCWWRYRPYYCRVVQWKRTSIAWRPILKHVASPHEISIPLHCRGIPGAHALAVKLLSQALKRTELTRYVTNVQIGKQLQQRPRACGPVISAVARAPPGSVSTPTEKHIDEEIRRITTARSIDTPYLVVIKECFRFLVCCYVWRPEPIKG